MGTYFFPLVLPRNTSFCRTVLYPLQFTYHVQKIHWNVVLCFAEPASPEEWTTDEDSGVEAFPSSYSLLALCMLMSRRFTKASNGFLVHHYPIFCWHHSWCCGEREVFWNVCISGPCCENATQPLQHSCIPPQGDVSYLCEYTETSCV